MNAMKKLMVMGLMLGCVNAAQGFGFDDLKKLVPMKKTQGEEQSQTQAQAQTETQASATANEKADAGVDQARDAQAKAQETQAKQAEAEAKMDHLVDENERVVKRLIASLLRVAEAQANFAEALDAKDQADKLRAESKALGEANYTDKKALHRHVKISKATNEVIQKKIEMNQELSKDGRKQFSTGMLHYVIAVKETKEMTDEIGPFYDATMAEVKTVQTLIDQARDQNKLALFIKNSTDYVKSRFGKKFATTRYLVKNGKGLAKDHKSTVTSVVEYARNNDIEVPAEVQNLDFI
ncbi:MAG: hypothetical protein CMK89_14590 [Pseudomonadales bacterium]|nr:hypothetical protein [Pseudomonadales bacterium]